MQIIDFLDNWLPAILILILTFQISRLEKKINNLEEKINDLQRD
ncbi:hypothetical protein [Caminibacter sp.]